MPQRKAALLEINLSLTSVTQLGPLCDRCAGMQGPEDVSGWEPRLENVKPPPPPYTHIHTWSFNVKQTCRRPDSINTPSSPLFNNPQNVGLPLTAWIGHCGGVSVFSLKSGRVISSHNACLCPPMPFASILIKFVLLSTSSAASKTHTSRKSSRRQSWVSHSSFFLVSTKIKIYIYILPVSACLFLSVAFFKNKNSAHMQIAGCHFLLNITLGFLFVSRSQGSAEE